MNFFCFFLFTKRRLFPLPSPSPSHQKNFRKTTNFLLRIQFQLVRIRRMETQSPSLGAQIARLRGAILALGYCIGLGTPFLLSGLFLDKSEKLRRVIVRRGKLITYIGGVMMVGMGLLQIFGIWNDLMNSLRSVISNFIPVV